MKSLVPYVKKKKVSPQVRYGSVGLCSQYKEAQAEGYGIGQTTLSHKARLSLKHTSQAFLQKHLNHFFWVSCEEPNSLLIK